MVNIPVNRGKYFFIPLTLNGGHLYIVDQFLYPVIIRYIVISLNTHLHYFRIHI